MAPERAGAPEAVAVNGLESTAVSALERGLHYGDGLFETIACVGGRARNLSLHLARLDRGIARLNIRFAHREELRAEIETLAAGVPRAIVKVLVTRGAALERGYRITGAEEATRVTLRYHWPEQGPAEAAGVRVRIGALRLSENPGLAGLKHLNRLEQVLARQEWRDPAIAEALLFNVSGNLISAVMSNIFLVQRGKLRTPRVDRSGVAGVMREVVMREAQRSGLTPEEALLTAADLEQATEVFLTSSLIGIRPVSALEGRTWTRGPVTRALQERVAALSAAGRDD